MAVTKFTSRQNPNKQLDLRFCAEAGCEVLSDVLVSDLPFSRSTIFSFVSSNLCSPVSVNGSSRDGGVVTPFMLAYNAGLQYWCTCDRSHLTNGTQVSPLGEMCTWGWYSLKNNVWDQVFAAGRGVKAEGVQGHDWEEEVTFGMYVEEEELIHIRCCLLLFMVIEVQSKSFLQYCTTSHTSETCSEFLVHFTLTFDGKVLRSSPQYCALTR